MTNDWYTADNAHILRAKKMASWRHGDLKLEAADIKATNDLIACSLREPGEVVAPTGFGSTYLPQYEVVGYEIGQYFEICKLQTAFDIYPAMGVVSTTEATPNVHDMSKRVAQTPTYQGRHLERENITTAEDEEIDILGMLLPSYHAECSELAPVATQSINSLVAYSINTDALTDDIPAAGLTDEPLKWHHFVFTDTFNSNPVEMDIIGWSFDIINTVLPTGLDSKKRFSIAKYIPLQFMSTTLEVRPYGRNPFEINRDAQPYTGDLDLVVKASRNTTTDYIQWTHDKCFQDKFTINVDRRPGSVERYFLRWNQMDTGSLAIQSKDAYNNDYYENP